MPNVAGGFLHWRAILSVGLLLVAVAVVGGGPAGAVGEPAGAATVDPEIEGPDVPVTAAAVPDRTGRLSGGGLHTCAVLDSGVLRCWGNNLLGQLGLGSTANLGDDEQVASRPGVDLGGRAVAVAGGLYHTCAVQQNGDVRCWGNNLAGQLGLGTTAGVGDDEVPASRPPVALGGRRALAVAAGANHSCALLDNRQVRCWGANESGQLGLGSTAGLGDDEPVTAVGPLDLGRPVLDVTAGQAHTCALLDTGQVRCWGANASGQLGIGSTEPIGDDEPALAGALVDLGPGRVAVAVSAGGNHTCALLDTGQVRCWGANGSGQLGLGSTTPLGDNEPVAAAPPVDLGAEAVAVAAGELHTCALLGSGQVRCWGAGFAGQRGSGSTDDGGDDEPPAALPVVDLGGRRATAVAAGWRHSCAVLAGGDVRCWGQNESGQLGLGSVANIGDNEAVPGTPTVQLGGSVSMTPRPASASRLVALGPVRIADTRGGPVPGPDSVTEVQVTGVAGVPADGVTAVVLTLTATESLAPGYLTAWPSGRPRPLASNLNVERPGQTVADLVTVPVGEGGRVAIYSQSGGHVVVDVAGYYRAVPYAFGGRYRALDPARVLDTRAGPQPGPDSVTDVQVAGQGGVPDQGASAVVLNVTATDAAGPGYVTAWPSGQPRPLASNLNLERPGQTLANQVVVPLGEGGRVSLYSQSGAHLVVDVAGWFTSGGGTPSASGLFVPLAPARHLDTRAGSPVPLDGTVVVPAAGHGAVPSGGVAAVVATLTATEALGDGYVTAFPSGSERPLASNLNPAAGQTVANHVTVRVGGDGGVALYTQAGGHLLVDVTGWYTS